MIRDPIVEELHRYREAHARKYGNDLRRIVASLKEVERRYPVVTRNPKPPPATAKNKSSRA
ncbi:MAG: hypothetical protein GDA55_01655 [Cellvibrionales bacterium]|nr:hypothetical protein [Cellvibrionales bacterium]